MDRNVQKLLNLLGLTTRAGKLISGEAQVISAIQKEKVSVVLCASDSSEATVKKLKNKCLYYQIPFIQPVDTITLSNAIGKKRSICAVADHGFAKSILKLNDVIRNEE